MVSLNSPNIGLFFFLCFICIVNSRNPLKRYQFKFPDNISSSKIRNNSEWKLQQSSQYPERPVVKTANGLLRGTTIRTIQGRKISAFQSIPYAEPPVGNLRFRSPVKAKPWNNTRNAMPQSPTCIQLDFVRDMQPVGQEDCLYLSVYVAEEFTNQNRSLDVMVWIHGGAFFFGSGSIYGPRYLLDHNIILVTINYRLGPFGFLSSGDLASPGNQGMKDQVLALQWIQENIAAFGGNPNSVTIFGESAGAASVGLHILSPLSKGLFHKAIMQSGSSLCFWSNVHNATGRFKQVAEVFNCSSNSSEETVECLRKVPEMEFVKVQLTFSQWDIHPAVVFGPTEEPEHAEAFMTKSPQEYYKAGEAQNVTLIAGLTQNEFTWLTSRQIIYPNLVNDTNTKWDQVGPILLAMDYNTTEINVERARKVWDFYMGNKQFNWENRLDFGRLFSDRFMTVCTLEAMRYHSMYTKQAVYGYQLNYQGRFSIVQQYGGKAADWGVSHLDDLIYLLDNPDYYQTLSLDDPELEMSRLMTQIWTSFATHGKPLVFGKTSVSQDVWKPIEPSKDIFSPLTLLELNTNPKMMDDPYVERYNFWKREINPNP